jgi:hypothetical protein
VIVQNGAIRAAIDDGGDGGGASGSGAGRQGKRQTVQAFALILGGFFFVLGILLTATAIPTFVVSLLMVGNGLIAFETPAVGR